jgi:hemerythrin superfamily protein
MGCPTWLRVRRRPRHRRFLRRRLPHLRRVHEDSQNGAFEASSFIGFIVEAIIALLANRSARVSCCQRPFAQPRLGRALEGYRERMDAITLLRNDHQTVEALFRRFEKAGDRAYVEKRELVDRIIEELSVHASIEEQIFYPVTRTLVPETEDIALESLEEHHIVKWVLSELDGLDPRHERFDAKVTVLIENVRHHVEEEQDDYFPKVRAALSRTQLAEIGLALEDAKRSAPTHPHPRAPDAPPSNVIGTIAGVVDRIADNVNGIAQGGVSAGQDLIDRLVGRSRQAASPTGTTTARRTAKSTRTAIDTAVDGVVQTGRSVKSGAEKVAVTAKAGAKDTTTSARSSVQKTATASRRAASSTARTATTAVKQVRSPAKNAAKKRLVTATG